MCESLRETRHVLSFIRTLGRPDLSNGDLKNVMNHIHDILKGEATYGGMFDFSDKEITELAVIDAMDAAIHSFG